MVNAGEKRSCFQALDLNTIEVFNAVGDAIAVTAVPNRFFKD